MRRFLITTALILTMTGCTLFPTPSTEGYDCDKPPEAVSKVHKVGDWDGESYLVTLNTSSTGVLAEASLLERQVNSLASAFGILDAKPLRVINGFEATLPKAVAKALAKDPRVLMVEQNGVKSISPIAGVEPAASLDWGYDRSDQRARNPNGKFEAFGDGSGANVWIIDTGSCYDSHRFIEQDPENCHGVFNDPWGCLDDHGHGCHVAGTAVGRSPNWGIAKAATLHTVRVLQNGSGTDADVLAGVDIMLDWYEQNDRPPTVANMSLGGSPSDTLDRGICKAITAGINFAVAAGNQDTTPVCRSSPARIVQAVSVGATEKGDSRAYFSSNDGNCETGLLGIFAPGYEIKSAKRGNGEQIMSGTSMASPHVAGALALCALEPDPVECVLGMATEGVVRDSRSATDDLVYVGQDGGG